MANVIALLFLITWMQLLAADLSSGNDLTSVFGSPCPTLDDPTLDFACFFNNESVACDEDPASDTIAIVTCKPGHVAPATGRVDVVTCLDTGAWSGTLTACVLSATAATSTSSVGAARLGAQVVAVKEDEDEDEGDEATLNRDLVNAEICGRTGVGLDVRTLEMEADTETEFDMPWMVVLKYSTRQGRFCYFCAGTVVSEKYVLTTARCVSHLKSTDKLVGVLLGVSNMAADPRQPIEIAIETTIVHPSYCQHTLKADIALLRLARAIDFAMEPVKPICLPLGANDSSRTFIGESLFVPGYNLRARARNATALRTGLLRYVPWVTCNRNYRQSRRYAWIAVTGDEMCVEGGTCHGENGGPLIQRGKDAYRDRLVVYGVQSHRPTCNATKLPIVATRVAAYAQWMRDNIRE